MPEVTHIATIKAPVQTVWEFVKDMDNWAPFMMGYKSHTTINDKESTWNLKSTILGVTYSFEMRVLITEWVDEEKVGFELNGLTHPVKGSGLVTMAPSNGDNTDISFKLNLQGKGMAAPVVNLVVAPLLKPMAEQLLDKINTELMTAPA
jgi:carbon monoxide dehydrogenase subunit G